ncbi:hypothetical protein EDD36DRAFT_418494 [Exophiala viscosa]|uniref:Amine oxidase domain-containing protein n=1 Tax=Exophiala viscosa TaxID=2486360 RepID=A0AAN6DYY3_9EURO|nr:hypothetical protein EDD36DRAFT_418494 [Exophiala viscosa]
MPSDRLSKARVAIIGAGVSGLRCADVLLSAGATNVKVFEARDRIGGRVHQIRSSGHLVDLGANWIHSTNANPILQLAHETNTQLFWRPSTQATVGSDGKRRDAKTTATLRERFWAYIDKAHEYSAQHAANIDPETSLMEFIKVTATMEIGQDPDFLRDLLNEAQRYGQFIGNPTSTQSLKFLCMEDEPGGTDAFLANTYRDILGYMAKQVVEKNLVHFGTEIKHMSMETTGEDSSILVETLQGISETFDEVVISCIRMAIENLGYGRLEKLYLTFPTAWWLEKPQDPLATMEDPYPCFTHFHDNAYGKHPPGLPSNVVVISLAHLPDGFAQPTLLFYIHGPCGTKVVQSVETLEPHSDTYNKAIDGFAKPYYSRLANYSDHNSSCKPISHFCSSWQLDPLAGKGSYTNIQTGSTQARKDLETLRDGAGLGESTGLWFVGEHTAPAAYLATVTGAYLSGERVANRILKKWES